MTRTPHLLKSNYPSDYRMLWMDRWIDELMNRWIDGLTISERLWADDECIVDLWTVVERMLIKRYLNVDVEEERGRRYMSDDVCTTEWRLNAQSNTGRWPIDSQCVQSKRNRNHVRNICCVDRYLCSVMSRTPVTQSAIAEERLSLLHK